MRLFIAVTFPEAVLRVLNERVSELKPKLPSASWVRPETQHLTFAFLGEQEESRIDSLSSAVAERVTQSGIVDAMLHGCGFFPNRRHARVGWVGVAPEDRFITLAGVVRQAVSAAGVQLDVNEFKAHLTLMRIREHWPPLAIDTFERALRDYRSATFAVSEITLYSSRLNPNGAIHTPLRTFSLA